MKITYEKLIDKMNNLSDYEKKLLLIYNSGLSYHINEITSIDEFMNKNPDEIIEEIHNKEEFYRKFRLFAKKINMTANKEIKNQFFDDIDFENISIFIENMKEKYMKINEVKNKIVLDEDITVYRGCSYSKDKFKISKGNLISTTLDPEITEKYLFIKKNNKNILYEIKVKKGTPLLVLPYSIKEIYDSEVDYLLGKMPKRLEVKNEVNSLQQEVILFKDTLDFELTKTKKIDEYNLTVEKYNTKLKEKNKTNVNTK